MRVAINGLGRVGRALLRQSLAHREPTRAARVSTGLTRPATALG